MGRPRKLSATERREAVLCLLRREEPAEMIARRVGVNKTTLHRWRDEFLAGGQAALAGGGSSSGDPRDRRIAQLEHEIEKRDQVIGEYTIANRILKKLSGESL